MINFVSADLFLTPTDSIPFHSVRPYVHCTNYIWGKCRKK